VSGRARGPAATSDRHRLRLQRERALAASFVVLLTVGALGAILLGHAAPGAIRLGEVSLGWWAAFAALGVLLIALPLAPRSARASGSD
jgi:hypothetical protein